MMRLTYKVSVATNVHMMRIMCVFLVAACDLYYGGGDRGPPAPDAATPTPPPDQPRYGCAMGLLPDSRTETFTPDAPVKSAVLNELQDAVIGHWRQEWTRAFALHQVFVSVGVGFAGVANPAGAGRPGVIGSSGDTTVEFDVPFEDGDELVGFEVDVFGNGLGQTLSVIHYPDVATVGTIKGTEVPGGGASWSRVAITPLTATALTSANILRFRAIVNGAGLCLGTGYATFRRVP